MFFLNWVVSNDGFSRRKWLYGKKYQNNIVLFPPKEATSEFIQ